MTQRDQVIKIMQLNGGFATLGFLNQNVDVSNWQTKTPFATIRRIVQDDEFFFKIKPGLWALKESKEMVLNKLQIKDKEENKEIFNHAYYQGLLIELGNLKGYETYAPPQDRNKLFLEKILGNISTINNIYNFSHQTIVDRAKNIDVIWFNHRQMPSCFWEVEHSSDFQNSILKFNDLQDFYSKFYIISSIERKREYEKKIKFDAFKEIKDRVIFKDYEYVSNYHSKSFELASLGSL